MSFNDVITLINVTLTLDDINQEIEEITENVVFADRKSIAQNEFVQAGRDGIRSAFRFDINTLDYNNETKISYNNEIYHVYRVYEKGDYIELYVEARSSDG